MTMRRRNANRGVVDDVLDGLYVVATKLPWYVDALLALVSYGVLHYVAGTYQVSGVGGGWNFLVATVVLLGQYVLAGVFVVGGIVSLTHSFRNGLRGRQLLSQAGSSKTMEMVSRMSWLDFELLIGQWFRTQGYEVTQAGGADDIGRAHPDGGVDIELHKDGELFLVQCKHYRSWKVPVEVVRELYGVMTSRGASGGFVVTSGHFTEPAIEFAEGRSITLLDGEKLLQILPQAKQGSEAKLANHTDTKSPMCPHCSSSMVRRTAHRGENTGNEFWGCSQYPACKGIIPIE